MSPLPKMPPFESADAKAKRYLEIRQQTLDWLKTDPRCKDFFKAYSPKSRAAFQISYAEAKADELVYAAEQNYWAERHLTQWRDEAVERYYEIQQLKYFVLQCQWQNYERPRTDFPGLEISDEWATWERWIDECPLLPPVTEDELSLYTDYLCSGEFYIEAVFGHLNKNGYQDFSYHRDGLLGRREPGFYASYPDFYRYAERHEPDAYPLTRWLTAPDTRSDREEHYVDVWWERHFGKPRNRHEMPKAQLSALDQDTCDRFAAQFEDARLVRYMHLYEAINDERRANEEDEVKMAWETLVQATTETNEAIELEAASDWRPALLKAASDYRGQRLAEAMELIFEEDQWRRAAGLGPIPYDADQAAATDPKNGRLPKWQVKSLEAKKQQIVAGRQQLGESPTLDF